MIEENQSNKEDQCPYCKKVITYKYVPSFFIGKENFRVGDYWTAECPCSASAVCKTIEEAAEAWLNNEDVIAIAKADEPVPDVKNCPFCDSGMYVEDYPWIHGIWEDEVMHFEISCPNCGATIRGDTSEQVVSDWNRRDGVKND